jgi:hypothetical protein
MYFWLQKRFLNTELRTLKRSGDVRGTQEFYK